MDGAIVTAIVGEAGQNLSGLVDLISALAYLMGIGFSFKAVLSLKEHSEDPEAVPIGGPLSMAVVAGLLVSLPSFLVLPNSSSPKIGQAETAVAIQDAKVSGTEASAAIGAGEAKTAEPLAKPAASPLATAALAPAKAIKIETLATPEEARAAADRKAIFEVLFGVALALAFGAIAWVAAKRRRTAAPSEALPEVQFLDGASKSGFAPSDIFAKTAAFDKAKAPARTPVQ